MSDFDGRWFRVISDQVRFGCGYRTVDGKKQFFAWHGYPSRNDDFFTTAEISWAEFEQIAREYPKELSADRDSAQVFRDSAPDAPVDGRIVYVGEMLDEQTRATDVMLECENGQRQLKPGMFVSVVFTTPKAEALLIPAAAVFQGEGGKYVYVEKEALHFERRPVRVESAGEGRVCVVSGLSVGERIIASGGIYLSE